MSQAVLATLRTDWPKRVALRADEVALVLRGKATRRVVERVRNNMKAGAYGKGARKIDGVWQLPLEDLAEVLDPTPPPMPDTPPPSKRRRAEVGPRVDFIRQAMFWADVFRAMGATDDANDLLSEATALREAMRMERWNARNLDTKKTLYDALGISPEKPPRKPGRF